MEFINTANPDVIHYTTAKEIAYLYVEGVDVLASPKEWRRIGKRLKQMGLGQWSTCPMTELEVMFVDLVIEEANRDLEREVDAFLEDMYLMNLLDGPDEEEEEEEE